MAKPVVFVDTSVLCNLLGIPRKCQHRDQIAEELKRRRRTSDLVLPVTAVIETGNHVAQIASGNERRTCAERLAVVIESVIAESAPWVLHRVHWDDSYLRSLLAGARTGTGFVDLAMSGIGGGDLSILVEVELYRARTAGVRVDIWTLDTQLAAYGGR